MDLFLCKTTPCKVGRASVLTLLWLPDTPRYQLPGGSAVARIGARLRGNAGAAAGFAKGSTRVTGPRRRSPHERLRDMRDPRGRPRGLARATATARLARHDARPDCRPAGQGLDQHHEPRSLRSARDRHRPAQSDRRRYRRQCRDKCRRARAAAAGEGADLVVFSELFICGYPPEDLVLKPALQAACRSRDRGAGASKPRMAARRC